MKPKNLIYVLLVALLILLAYMFLFRRPTVPAELSSIDATIDSMDKYLSTIKSEVWNLDNFNDEFGAPTSKKFIKTYSSGVFSNSATSNSSLYVEIIVTKTDVGIFLHEYERTNPPAKFIGTGKIKMKNSANEIIQVNSYYEWNQNGGIAISNIEENNYTKFISFLKKSEGVIKVVIHDEYSSEYNFNVDVTGFKEKFESLSKK